MSSKFSSPFMAKSPLLEAELTRREKRKARKAGKAGAKSEKEGISEKKKKRLVEKSNKKLMQAAGVETYANKDKDGRVGLRSTPKVSAVADISGKAAKKQKEKQSANLMVKSPLNVDPFAKPKEDPNPPQYHAQKIKSKIAMMPSSAVKPVVNAVKKGVKGFIDFYSGAKKKLNTKK